MGGQQFKTPLLIPSGTFLVLHFVNGAFEEKCPTLTLGSIFTRRVFCSLVQQQLELRTFKTSFFLSEYFSMSPNVPPSFFFDNLQNKLDFQKVRRSPFFNFQCFEIYQNEYLRHATFSGRYKSDNFLKNVFSLGKKRFPSLFEHESHSLGV